MACPYFFTSLLFFTKICYNIRMAEEEKQIGQYIKILWWPIILTLVFEIAALFTNNASVLIVAADIFLVLYMIVKAQIINHKIAAWLGGIVIGIIALIVAVAEFVINFKFYYFFNIIVEPIIYGAGAALLSSGIVLIINRLKIKTMEIKKGGEQNGRK